MKICFIVNSLKNRSGVERVLSLLGNYFYLKNIDIVILNRDSDFEDSAFELNKNIKVENLEGNLLEFYIKINKFLKINQFDLILVHNMGKLTPFSCLLKTSIPIVSFEHISFVTRPKYLRVISKLLYKKVKHIVVLNHDDKKAFNAIGFNNVSVIPNPLPYGIIKEDTVKSFMYNKVIAVGRLTYQKNFHSLINAWGQISNLPENWVLEIYGDGEDKNSLIQLIEDKKIDNVYIKSNTNDLKEVYSSSSFLVLSSRYEGFGMVLIEALAFGLPIISYDCPYGPSEIIQDGFNGYLVENQDVNELSKKIGILIEDFNLRKSLAANSIVSAKRYEIEHIYLNWLQVFEEVKN